MHAMDATNAILHAMDATNAISHMTHATNAILHEISHHLTIETLHQYSTSTTCPARGYLPCDWNGTVEQILWPWLLCQGAGTGMTEWTVSQKFLLHATLHLLHVMDATNAIVISHVMHAINGISHAT